MTATPTETLLDEALFWASQDVPVFPLNWPIDGKCSCPRGAECKNPGKHPLAKLVPNGLTDATTDPDVIRSWWTKFPQANLGVRTGYAFDVLDIDGELGAETFKRLAAKHGSPQHVADVATGRDLGLHLFVVPGGQKNETGGLGGMPPGIDVRGRGGYIVAPPSLHVSGNRYEWLSHFRDGVILGNRDWPEWIAEVKTAENAKPTPTPTRPGFVQPTVFAPGGDPAAAYAQAVLRRAVGLVEGSFEGHRWQTLALEAIPLVARAVDGGGLDLDEGVDALEKAATDAGLDTTEVRRIRGLVEGMIARGIRNPIRPAEAPLQSFASEDEAQFTEWEPPEPLSREVPPFPTEVLGWLEEPVLELSRRLQTPPDLAGMMTLALVASCIRGRARVQVGPGWDEPLNLFLAVVLASGETKSPLVAAIFRRMREVEKMRQADAAGLIAAATDMRSIHENALRKAIADAKSGAPEMLAEVFDARQRLDANPVPARPLLLAGDMTPEAMVKLLAEQGGTLAHISAEGGLLDTFVGGRYSGGQAQVTDLLNAHDGREPIKVHRKGADDLIVWEPSLTIGVAIQPQVLEALGENPVAMRRGLHARFLFAVPKSLVGSRNMISVRESSGVEEAFAGLTDALMDDRFWGGLTTSGNSFLSLSEPFRRGGSEYSSNTSEDCVSHSLRYEIRDSSSSLLIQYRKHLEPRRHPIIGDLANLAAWANKLDGQVSRLSAILQIIRDTDPRSPSYLGNGTHNPRNVSPEAMADAIVLAEYLIGHAIEAHALMVGGQDDLTKARQLWGWITSHELSEFTVRDVYQGLRKRKSAVLAFPDVAAVQSAADALAARGWIWPVPAERGRPGRPPSPRYLVHPDAP